ncbi:PIN domain-containing protein [bacterium]|nr:PIN domain-containing protein [bacterium]
MIIPQSQMLWVYQPLIEGRQHPPDADDQHVLAVAIVSNVDAIITSNLKGLPADVLLPKE